MANAILTKQDAEAAFNITLNSLATSAAGVGNASDAVVNNTNRPAALVYAQVMSGAAAPTVGSIYEVYYLWDDDNATPLRADAWNGAATVGLTIENAPMLGAIVVTATANKAFMDRFDTAPLGPLSSSWGIAVVNTTGQTTHATAANSFARYCTYYPEIQ